MATNYYDILNVSKDADNRAISEAYKKMALKWHPDKNLDDIEEAKRRFQQISEAYQVLSDSSKRLRYDRGQSANHRHGFFDSDDDDDDDMYGPHFHFIRAEMLFRHFFRQFDHRDFHYPGEFNGRHHCHGRNRDGKAKDGRRDNKRNENGNAGTTTSGKMCQIRTVNGKQWMTKTFYEDGNKIVTRYEDGELISKQVNGVFQKIQK